MPILDGGGPSGLPAPESGLTTIQMITTRVQRQLLDLTGNRWDDEVLLPYLYDFTLETITLKPDSLPITKEITLVEGSVQSIDDTDVELLDVVMNLGTEGTSRTRAITVVSRKQVDVLFPMWNRLTASATVKYAVLDDVDRRKFFVIPPQPATNPGHVEIMVTATPTDYTDSSNAFPFDVTYIPAAVNYLIYKALFEDTTEPESIKKATTAYNMYLQNIGMKTSTDKKMGAGAKGIPTNTGGVVMSGGGKNDSGNE